MAKKPVIHSSKKIEQVIFPYDPEQEEISSALSKRDLDAIAASPVALASNRDADTVYYPVVLHIAHEGAESDAYAMMTPLTLFENMESWLTNYHTNSGNTFPNIQFKLANKLRLGDLDPLFSDEGMRFDYRDLLSADEQVAYDEAPLTFWEEELGMDINSFEGTYISFGQAPGWMRWDIGSKLTSAIEAKINTISQMVNGHNLDASPIYNYSGNRIYSHKLNLPTVNFLYGVEATSFSSAGNSISEELGPNKPRTGFYSAQKSFTSSWEHIHEFGHQHGVTHPFYPLSISNIGEKDGSGELVADLNIPLELPFEYTDADSNIIDFSTVSVDEAHYLDYIWNRLPAFLTTDFTSKYTWINGDETSAPVVSLSGDREYSNSLAIPLWDALSTTLYGIQSWWGGSYTESGDNKTLVVNATAPMIHGDMQEAASLSGYSDWYLPSRYELLEMYNTIGNGGPDGNIGGFESNYYLSSSESSANGAYIINLGGGGTASDGKANGRRARFIRSASIFPTDNQVGEAYEGGLIFYKDEASGECYIASLEDVEDEYVWGCHGTEISGADGQSIGTGYQNTVDIVAGCLEIPTAASEALAYTNNYSVSADWYIPSRNEVIELFTAFYDTPEVFTGPFADTLHYADSSSAQGSSQGVRTSSTSVTSGTYGDTKRLIYFGSDADPFYRLYGSLQTALMDTIAIKTATVYPENKVLGDQHEGGVIFYKGVNKFLKYTQSIEENICLVYSDEDIGGYALGMPGVTITPKTIIQHLVDNSDTDSAYYISSLHRIGGGEVIKSIVTDMISEGGSFYGDDGSMNIYGAARSLFIVTELEEATEVVSPIPDISIKSRIPFCKLVEDIDSASDTFGQQIPGNEYDIFWALNFNQNNPAYPEYPANTPVTDLYNIEFCPCLHSTQTFISNGEGFDFTLMGVNQNLTIFGTSNYPNYSLEDQFEFNEGAEKISITQSIREFSKEFIVGLGEGQNWKTSEGFRQVTDSISIPMIGYFGFGTNTILPKHYEFSKIYVEGYSGLSPYLFKQFGYQNSTFRWGVIKHPNGFSSNAITKMDNVHRYKTGSEDPEEVLYNPFYIPNFPTSWGEDVTENDKDVYRAISSPIYGDMDEGTFSDMMGYQTIGFNPITNSMPPLIADRMQTLANSGLAPWKGVREFGEEIDLENLAAEPSYIENHSGNYVQAYLDAFISRVNAFDTVGAVGGCMDSTMLNYTGAATYDNGTCIDIVYGCMEDWADNFSFDANVSDSSCYKVGCTDPEATIDGIYYGYDALATVEAEGGSCIYEYQPIKTIVRVVCTDSYDDGACNQLNESITLINRNEGGTQCIGEGCTVETYNLGELVYGGDLAEHEATYPDVPYVSIFPISNIETYVDTLTSFPGVVDNFDSYTEGDHFLLDRILGGDLNSPSQFVYNCVENPMLPDGSGGCILLTYSNTNATYPQYGCAYPQIDYSANFGCDSGTLFEGGSVGSSAELTGDAGQTLTFGSCEDVNPIYIIANDIHPLGVFIGEDELPTVTDACQVALYGNNIDICPEGPVEIDSPPSAPTAPSGEGRSGRATSRVVMYAASDIFLFTLTGAPYSGYITINNGIRYIYNIDTQETGARLYTRNEQLRDNLPLNVSEKLSLKFNGSVDKIRNLLKFNIGQ